MNSHDPYPTTNDADENKLVLKLQRPLGRPLGGDELDLRISPYEAGELKQTLTDNGFHVSDVIELSAQEILHVATISVSVSGGVGALSYVIIEFLRKDRGKEYRLYVNGREIELKGLSVRQARRMITAQTLAVLGQESRPSEDEHSDKAGDDELLD